LAKLLDCEIVSADSRQFYKEMSIGTAKPTLDEQKTIPHHFIDSHSITTPLSAFQFETEALVILDELFLKSDNVILVGGSGLFIDALCDGLDHYPSDKKIQDFYLNQLEEKGIENLQIILKGKDPENFEKIDVQNPHRLIRALEIIHLSGKPMSESQIKTRKERNFKTHRFILNWEREILYQRINERVDLMIDQGLVEEVKSLSSYKHLQSLNTVGYKEIFDWLDGNTSREEAIVQLKQNTRRYAKRQLTWFRKNQNNCWVVGENQEEKINFILQKIRENKAS
jgi:tRNA dimethylallyltransferase